MTLEELQNLVSELGERYTDATEVVVATPHLLFKPDKVIAGHYEDAAGSRIVLILADRGPASTGGTP